MIIYDNGLLLIDRWMDRWLWKVTVGYERLSMIAWMDVYGWIYGWLWMVVDDYGY